MTITKTKHMKEHMNKMAEFGCLICHKMGFPKSPCQLHHIKILEVWERNLVIMK